MNTSGSKASIYFLIGRHLASDRETPETSHCTRWRTTVAPRASPKRIQIMQLQLTVTAKQKMSSMMQDSQLMKKL